MRRPSLVAAALVLAGTVSGCGFLGIGDPADLQVYSARHYDLEEAFAEFTDETGITVEFLYDDDAVLLERLKKEGPESPADIFMTVDAGYLWNAAREDQLQPVDSPVLQQAVPEDLRDDEGRWYGLAMRARTVVYNPDNVDPAEFDTQNTYAGLTDPMWQGRLCMRDETASYTQSLVASLIDLHGRERALEIVEGWVRNDVEVMSNDILLLEAVDAGECDVAITNHYYLARLLEENEDFNAKVFWASQDGAGVHVNISGAGVTQSSDNVAQAQRLMEWLATDGQSNFVDANHEYPVNPDVEPEPLIAEWGDFERMPIDAAAYGRLNAEAVDVLAEAGYQ